MSREMRSCLSLRACRTFVSASVGGSQEKSSASGEREAQETEGSCPSGIPLAPRNHRPPTAQSLTSTVQSHVAVVATRLTGRDVQAERFPLGSAPLYLGLG